MTLRDIAIAIGFDVDKSSEKKVEDSIKSVKTFATKMLGTIAIGFSFVKMNALAEEFKGINNKIKQATAGLEDQEEVQKKILKAANDTKSSYASTANAVNKLVQESNGFFQSVDDAIAFNNATTKLFKTAGRAESEIGALQGILNHAFAKGSVDVQTLNTLMQSSPESIKVLNKQFGVTSDKLLQMAANGKISATTLKKAFLSASGEINKGFEDLDYSISDAMLNIRNQWGLFCDSLWTGSGIASGLGKMMVRAFTSFMDILKKIQPYIERVIKFVLSGVQKAMDLIQRVGSFLGRLINKIGGIDQALKLVAITAGAIWLALNAKKILDFVKGLGKALSGINFKIMLIVAVIVALALIIEDFINFMKGNNSVIGTLFEKAGIDADKVREKITNIWKTIQTTLSSIWKTIQRVATGIFDKLKEFWEKNGESVAETFTKAWEAIKIALSAIWETIESIAASIFNGLKEFWEEWGDTILEKFQTTFDFILDVISGLSDFVSGVFSGDWSKAWDGITSILGNAIDFISDILGPVAPIFMGIVAAVLAYKAVQIATAAATKAMSIAQKASTIATKAATAGQWLLNAALSANPIGLVIAAIAALIAIFIMLWRNNEDFRNFFLGMWDNIVGFLQGIWENIKAVFSAVSDFFKDIFQSAWDAICSVFDGVTHFFGGIWDKIVGIFGTIGTAISDAIGGAVKGAINGVLNGAAGIINGFITLINGAISVINAIPGVKISKLQKLEVPQLAEGGIATKATHAIVGEGSEKEAIMPLSKLGNMISGYIREAKESQSVNRAKEMIHAFISKISSLSPLSSAATAKPATASMVANSKNIHVTQKVEINNSYSGGTPEMQKKVSEGMQKSATDATDYMAKGLAYLR